MGLQMGIVDKAINKVCIRLISVLPFPGYDSTWPSELQDRARRIRMNCCEVIYASQEASKGAYLLRDRMMVDRADCCISYCNQRSGGTAYTVRYAFEKNISVYNASSWDVTQLRSKKLAQSGGYWDVKTRRLFN